METLDLMERIAGLAISGIIFVVLCLLARAITRINWVVTLHVPASTSSTIQGEPPKSARVVVAQAHVIEKIPKKPTFPPNRIEQEAQVPKKAKNYPQCPKCKASVKGSPTNCIMSDESVTNVYKCKCGEEVKVIRPLEPPPQKPSHG